MKKRVVKILYKLGLRRLASWISPSLAHYYATVDFAEIFYSGIKDGIKNGHNQE